MEIKSKYKFVNYLWDEKNAKEFGDDQVALFLYRSNILGADLRITNFGGGNTSCKTIEKDPITNEPVEVMWIKGSSIEVHAKSPKEVDVPCMLIASTSCHSILGRTS